MIYPYIILLLLGAASAVITTWQTALTVLFRRRRRQGSPSVFPAGRFGRTGRFRFDPEAALWSR